MACHLLGAKTLPGPMVTYCQLDPWEQISVNVKSIFKHFHWRKCIWTCRLGNCRHVFRGEMSWMNIIDIICDGSIVYCYARHLFGDKPMLISYSSTYIRHLGEKRLKYKLDPDSKIHVVHLSHVGPRWAPCGPQETSWGVLGCCATYPCSNRSVGKISVWNCRQEIVGTFGDITLPVAWPVIDVSWN